MSRCVQTFDWQFTIKFTLAHKVKLLCSSVWINIHGQHHSSESAVACYLRRSKVFWFPQAFHTEILCISMSAYCIFKWQYKKTTLKFNFFFFKALATVKRLSLSLACLDRPFWIWTHLLHCISLSKSICRVVHRALLVYGEPGHSKNKKWVLDGGDWWNVEENKQIVIKHPSLSLRDAC